MHNINKVQQEIIDEFNMFEDWIQKYEYIIDMGKELAPIEEKHKVEKNLIRGCQSRVWLHAELKNDRLFFHGDSDAIMTKGIVALLLRVLSEQKPEDIINSKLDFLNKIGLKEQLSATRANGLASMVKQMKIYALAYNN
jgi:cysteine desulfuration protein SufE